MAIPNEFAKDDVRLVFGYLVEILDFFYHVNIVFFALLGEFGLDHYKKVFALFSLEGYALSVWR